MQCGKDKLEALRQEMDKAGVDCLLLPRTDAYQGEFIAPHDERLAWLTGFTGSAGYAVIMLEAAYIFTDSRYTLQVKQEVDLACHEVINSQETKPLDWLKAQFASGAFQVAGIDPWLMTCRDVSVLEEAGLPLQVLEENLVDALWEEQPAAPSEAVEVFPLRIAGRSPAEKIADVVGFLQEQELDGYVFCDPQDVAWLLNIRSSDVPYTPVALSRLVVTLEGRVIWAIDPARVSKDVLEVVGLGDDLLVVTPEDFVYEMREVQACGADGAQMPYALKVLIEAQGARMQTCSNPVPLWRAQKTEAEQRSLKEVHERDGLAVMRTMCWVEEQFTRGIAFNEVDVDLALQRERGRNRDYRGASFGTIAGFADNGAVVHYRAEAQTAKEITEPGVLLIDSGGQYAGGTTDITRTMVLGELESELLEDVRAAYTAVLQGHIAVATARFTRETTGRDLDALARQPLQAIGLDYGHGTGHGVGCFLSVHEYAPSISPRGEGTYLPGMLLSNEPGYYEEGRFGIRLENLVLVQEDEQGLYFETVTLVPFDMRLVNQAHLSVREKEWLRLYHERIREVLSSQMDQLGKDWVQSLVQA